MATPPRVIHKKTVAFEDSDEAASAGELLPSDWNDDHELVGVAGLDSPAFLNTPTAPTPPFGDASTRLATMEAVARAVNAVSQQTLTAAGNVTIDKAITLVIVKKIVPAAFQINLPLSTDLAAEEITIKDRMLANGAGAGTYNITVAMQGAETVDGNASVKIDVDNMALTFRKIRDDAGNVTGEGYELI